MKIFFSVGEPSGDLHASNLIQQLRRHDPDLETVGFGGTKMEAAGCRILFRMTELAIMFFGSAIRRLPQFIRLLRMAGRYLDENPVDAIVLIDFSGFNWWMAWQGKRRGIPVFYYGVPQMWAWAPWRIKKLKRRVDHVLCKLPFEEKWFRERGVQAVYVGHPYFDELQQHQPDSSWIESFRSCRSPHLVLLPGSRNSEVERHAPVMLESARWLRQEIPALRVSFACYDQRHQRMIQAMLQNTDDQIECHVGRTLDLMQAADACLACSGSASLELMYYHCPSVIVYRLSRVARSVMPWLIQCRFITLVNLIASDSIAGPLWALRPADSRDPAPPMPEHVFTQAEPAKICGELKEWLSDTEKRAVAAERLKALAERFAHPGASQRAAEYIVTALNSRIATSAQSKRAA